MKSIHAMALAGLSAGALIAASPSAARVFTTDGLTTYDQAARDSAGAFLNGELERLDQKLHLPLVSFTWGRDIDLREDVTMGDEASSFTNSSFASPGGSNSRGKSWSAKTVNSNPGISLDIGKTANPLTLWSEEVGWSLPELISAQQMGRPIDQQKYNGMQLKWNLDIDEQVYVGDTLLGFQGLFNNTNVTANAVTAGAGGSRLWAQKTPDEILADVNTLLTNTWSAAGWAVMPDMLRLPPDQYAYIVSQKVSLAGNVSILKFLQENNLVKTSTGTDLNIQPVKWLIGCATGGTIGVADGHNRMVAYSKNPDMVRFPMTLLSRTPVENRGLWQITTYYCRLGVVEFVYPETVQYADGIG